MNLLASLQQGRGSGMGINLFEHNQTAYKAVVSMLETAGKAAVIHPTGTGKSLIALKLCEENQNRRICWLSPSEYIFQTQIENWKQLDRQGSDRSILPNIFFYTYAKLMRMGQAELAQIKPDYIILDEFHRCGAAGWGRGVEKLCEIYPKAKIVGLSATNIRYLDNQRDMAWELFDGNIASELTLGEAIARGILPMPKYVLSIYSYQKELKRYEMRVQQAKHKVVRDQAEKQLEALRRALEKADGMEEIFAKHLNAENKKISEDKSISEYRNFSGYGKYLVFCASYDHLNEMKELAPEWFAKVDPAPHIYTVYSDDPKTAQEFQAFQADHSRHLKLLYCIDMLNEGIHLNGIDGVILLRPTVSPTIYKQQIGRALAAGGKKQPVIFDIVMNIENLYSIGAIEEELREAVFSYRAIGKEDKIVQEHFQIIDEVKDCRALFASLNETLGASWDAMYAMAKDYAETYGNLNVPKRYKTPDGYSLGMWLATQKKVYSGKVSGRLTESQIEQLTKIGMNWKNTRELTWEKHYAKAAEYYKEHGNLLVENKTKDCRKEDIFAEEKEERDAALARWLARLRAERKRADLAVEQGKKTNDGSLKNQSGSAFLTPERIAMLDALGMVWDRTEFVWGQYFEAAKRYYEEYRNLDVPSYYITPDGRRLGRWIAAQRKLRKQELRKNSREKQIQDGSAKQTTKKNDTRSKKKINGQDNKQQKKDKKIEISQQNETICCEVGISVNQIEKLNQIGMIWETKSNTTWEKSYNAACEYYNMHGNLDVPATYRTADGCRLGRWIRRQKDAYQTSRLPDVKVQKLEQIAMVWETKDSWMHRFQLAKEYYKNHGNLDMPSDYIVDGIWLARWLREQKTKITTEKINKMKVFTLKKQNSNLTKRIQKKSVFVVKASRKKQPVRSNKAEKRTKKSLTSEQKELLASISIFIEKPRTEVLWQKQYKEAAEFYCMYGHLSIPKRYVGKSGKNLGLWIQRQRTARRHNSLTDEQIALLDCLKMVWEPEAPWEIGYQHAKEYYKKNGHLAVPYAYVNTDGYRLGKWISNQRSAYQKEQQFSQEQRKRLEEIGMIWSAKPGRTRTERKIKNVKEKNKDQIKTKNLNGAGNHVGYITI